MEDVRLLAFDTSIMQSKTVNNICRLLRDGIDSESLKEAVQVILLQQAIAQKKRNTRVKGRLKTKRTTVDRKIKELKEK